MSWAIDGIAVAVPSGVCQTEAWSSELGEKYIKRFIKTTGVEKRHLCSVTSSKHRITTSDLGFSAAKKLFIDLNVNPLEIDAVIFLSQYPDYGGSPATACVLQHRLGLRPDVMAFDVNQGCAGYIYGLKIASSLVSNGSLAKVLLIAGDANHKIDPNDHSQGLLLGDACSATVISSVNNCNGAPEIVFRTLGGGFRSLITPSGGTRHPIIFDLESRRPVGNQKGLYATMNGADVFNFSITEVPSFLQEFLDRQKVSIASINRFIFHQPNMLMLKEIARRLNVGFDLVATSLESFGNTSSASIPTTLCHRRETIAGNVLLCGFGVGLSMGATVLNFDHVSLSKVVWTEDGWDDELYRYRR